MTATRPVQMTPQAAVLAQSPLFSQPVISATGKMHYDEHDRPGRTFVELKRWMAGLPTRIPAKCRRDALQADVVQAMLAPKLRPPRWTAPDSFSDGWAVGGAGPTRSAMLYPHAFRLFAAA